LPTLAYTKISSAKVKLLYVYIQAIIINNFLYTLNSQSEIELSAHP